MPRFDNREVKLFTIFLTTVLGLDDFQIHVHVFGGGGVGFKSRASQWWGSAEPLRDIPSPQS